MIDTTAALQAVQALADRASAVLTAAKDNVRATALAAEQAVAAAARAELDSLAAEAALEAMKVTAGVSTPKPAGSSGIDRRWLIAGGVVLALGLAVAAWLQYGPK